MLSPRSSLRVMPALWLAVPIIVLAAAYGTALYPSDHYGLGATAMASGILPFVGGFVTATAAWEGARLRRAVWPTPIVRSRLAVAGWAVLPSIVVGLAAVVAATAVLLARSGAAVPDVRILAVVALDLVAWAAAGFALGILLPVPVAVPAGILLPFIWFAFIPAMEPVWLRHFTGMFRDCCGLNEDLSAAAVAASALADVGILAAAAVAVGGAGSLRRAAASALALAVPMAAAVVLVSGMTYAPVSPRDASLLDCRASSGVTLCVWPEHAPAADAYLSAAVAVRGRWAAAGIESPSLVTEAGRSTAPAGSLSVSLAGTGPDDVVRAVAEAMTPQQPECIDPTTGASMGTTGGIAVQWLEAWYAAAGGMSPGRLAEQFGSTWNLGGTTLDPLPTVDALWKVSPEARRAWVAHATSMITTCDEVVQDLTVRP
jgi:hypothetical protein